MEQAAGIVNAKIDGKASRNGPSAVIKWGERESERSRINSLAETAYEQPTQMIRDLSPFHHRTGQSCQRDSDLLHQPHHEEWSQWATRQKVGLRSQV